MTVINGAIQYSTVTFKKLRTNNLPLTTLTY